MQPTRARRRFRLIVPKFPTFNIYSNAARTTTALGPLCVATAVSKLPGWDVEVIDENNYRFPGPMDDQGFPDHRLLQRLRPVDAVGLYGGLSSTAPRVYELARFYESQGALVVAGGQHVDFLPEEALGSGVDVVVHGEAEQTIEQLLDAWERGAPLADVAGLSLRVGDQVQRTAERPPLEQFESLPVPDFGLLRYARVKIYPVSRIRGCAMRCEFCTVKGRARCASPERLLEQCSRLAETWGARRFFIVDDQFAQDRAETLRFCRLLAEYQRRMQLRFDLFVQIRLSHARDQELLDAMRACGIRILAIGYESVVDEELAAMGKGQRAARMLDLTRRYQKSGFIIHGMFIFGYPLKPPVPPGLPSVDERVRQTRRFLRKARLDTVQVLHAVPLPGTPFRERLLKQGRIFPLSEVGWEYYDGNFQLIEPDPPATALQMQEATLRIMRGVYRFTALFTLAWRVLTFPIAMLPLWSLRSRWSRWSQSWRRNVLELAGWNLMRRWKKRFRQAPYRQKVLRASQQR